jgi:predicted permease
MLHWLSSILGDLHFAIRLFRRTPVATITLIAVLAIGIGAHGAIFAFAQAVTTRPVAGVPVNRPLVRIRGTEERDSASRDKYPRGLSYPELIDLAQHRERFNSVAGWSTAVVTVAADSLAAVHIGTVHFATENLFPTLGIHVAVGRDLTDADTLGAVISDPLWHELFAAAPDVVGRALRVNNTTVQIVGVAPQHFQGPIGPEGERTLWLPVAARHAVIGGGADALASRDSTLFNAVAETATGVSLADANRTVVNVAASSLATTSPLPGVFHRSADVVALRGTTSLPVAWSENVFFTKYGATVALLILILVCINVSALQVGAARARRQEIAIRISLGASRGRIVRQLLTESIVIAVAGGGVGLALYVVLVHWLGAANSSLQLNPDIATIGYTVLIAAGTGIVFGLSPALHATRVPPGVVMKDAGGTTGARSRLQERFILAQVALTQPFLLAVVLMITQVVLPATGKGVAEPLGTHVMRIDLKWWTVGNAFKETVPRVGAALDEIRAIPGVQGVVGINGNRLRTSVALETAGSPNVPAEYQTVQPGMMTLLDVPFREGRELVAADSMLADEAVIVTSRFAHQLFGNAPAIGKRLSLHVRGDASRPHGVIVGVIDPPKLGSLPELLDMAVLARGSNASSAEFGQYLVRTAGPAEGVIPQVTATLRAAAPRLATVTETLAQRDDAASARTFWTAAFAAACGVVVLLLCSLGLYAIVALSVGHHRREIGVRMALGARQGQVVWLFLQRGLRLGARGTAYGLPISLLALVLIAPMQVWQATLVAGLGVAALVLIVAIVASWIPAHRAAGVPPTEAMRG